MVGRAKSRGRSSGASKPKRGRGGSGEHGSRGRGRSRGLGRGRGRGKRGTALANADEAHIDERPSTTKKTFKLNMPKSSESRTKLSKLQSTASSLTSSVPMPAKDSVPDTVCPDSGQLRVVRPPPNIVAAARGAARDAVRHASEASRRAAAGNVVKGRDNATMGMNPPIRGGRRGRKLAIPVKRHPESLSRRRSSSSSADSDESGWVASVAAAAAAAAAAKRGGRPQPAPVMGRKATMDALQSYYNRPVTIGKEQFRVPPPPAPTPTRSTHGGLTTAMTLTLPTKDERKVDEELDDNEEEDDPGEEDDDEEEEEEEEEETEKREDNPRSSLPPPTDDLLMRPGRVTVLDPVAARQANLTSAVNRAARIEQRESGDDFLERLLDSFIPTQDTMESFERLDVLVCGKCRTVFHLVDEFKSHSSTCQGQAAIEQSISARATDGAAAMVLWCATIRRRLGERGSVATDKEDLERRIKSKWHRLSRKARERWIVAARSLRDLGEAGRIVFGGREAYPNLLRERCPSWIADTDQEGLAKVKQEAEEEWQNLGSDSEDKGTQGWITARPTFSLSRSRSSSSGGALQARPKSMTSNSTQTEEYAADTVEEPAPEAASSAVPALSSKATSDGDKTAEQSPVSEDSQTDDGHGEAMEILAKKGDEYCVLLKGRRDPVWRLADQLNSGLVKDFEAKFGANASPIRSVVDSSAGPSRASMDAEHEQTDERVLSPPDFSITEEDEDDEGSAKYEDVNQEEQVHASSSPSRGRGRRSGRGRPRGRPRGSGRGGAACYALAVGSIARNNVSRSRGRARGRSRGRGRLSKLLTDQDMQPTSAADDHRPKRKCQEEAIDRVRRWAVGEDVEPFTSRRDEADNATSPTRKPRSPHKKYGSDSSSPLPTSAAEKLPTPSKVPPVQVLKLGAAGGPQTLRQVFGQSSSGTMERKRPKKTPISFKEDDESTSTEESEFEDSPPLTPATGSRKRKRKTEADFTDDSDDADYVPKRLSHVRHVHTDGKEDFRLHSPALAGVKTHQMLRPSPRKRGRPPGTTTKGSILAKPSSQQQYVRLTFGDGTAVAGTTSVTPAASNARSPPSTVTSTTDQLQEVTTTSTLEDRLKIGRARDSAEFCLDPVSGLVVDKLGQPFNMEQDSFTNLENVQQQPMALAPTTSYGHQPLNVLDDIGGHAQQQQPARQLQMAEDGTVSMAPLDVNLQQPQFVTQQHIQAQPPQTSNKVLLVLPGGQMILTDLTDEQCGQLNIKVGDTGVGQTDETPKQPSTLQIELGGQQETVNVTTQPQGQRVHLEPREEPHHQHLQGHDHLPTLSIQHEDQRQLESSDQQHQHHDELPQIGAHPLEELHERNNLDQGKEELKKYDSSLKKRNEDHDQAASDSREPSEKSHTEQTSGSKASNVDADDLQLPFPAPKAAVESNKERAPPAAETQVEVGGDLDDVDLSELSQAVEETVEKKADEVMGKTD